MVDDTWFPTDKSLHILPESTPDSHYLHRILKQLLLTSFVDHNQGPVVQNFVSLTLSLNLHFFTYDVYNDFKSKYNIIFC